MLIFVMRIKIYLNKKIRIISSTYKYLDIIHGYIYLSIFFTHYICIKFRNNYSRASKWKTINFEHIDTESITYWKQSNVKLL